MRNYLNKHVKNPDTLKMYDLLLSVSAMRFVCCAGKDKYGYNNYFEIVSRDGVSISYINPKYVPIFTNTYWGYTGFDQGCILIHRSNGRKITKEEGLQIITKWVQENDGKDVDGKTIKIPDAVRDFIL